MADWPYEKIWKTFCQLRWPDTDGQPVCPKCDRLDHYFIRTREQWRCKHCSHTFSLTSGTWLSSTKLPLKKILIGIVIMAYAVKGLSALELSRHMNTQQKTALIFYLKLRDALLQLRDDQPALKGQVEVDGAYLNPTWRNSNRKEDRATKSKLSKRPKQCILALRMRDPKGVGANRTLTFVIDKERAEEVIDIVEQNVTANTEVITDQHRAYSDLMVYFKHTTVNHDMHFMGPNGENTNQAESFFSRFRRLVRGQVHHLGPDYLNLYANEMAYREDTRRWPNGRIAYDMIGKLLTIVPKNKESRFRGYWERSTRSLGDEAALGFVA